MASEGFSVFSIIAVAPYPGPPLGPQEAPQAPDEGARRDACPGEAGGPAEEEPAAAGRDGHHSQGRRQAGLLALHPRHHGEQQPRLPEGGGEAGGEAAPDGDAGARRAALP